MNEQIIKTQRARIEYLESVCKEFEMMEEVTADKIAALKQHNAELTQALSDMLFATARVEGLIIEAARKNAESIMKKHANS